MPDTTRPRRRALPPQTTHRDTGSWIVPAIPPPNPGSIGSPNPVPAVTPAPVRVEKPKSRRSGSRPDYERQPTPDVLRVKLWEDHLARTTLPADGFYVERYYGPVIGPTSLLLLRALSVRLRSQPEGFELPTSVLAASIGCSSKAGVNSQFWRALRRGARFGLFRQRDDRVLVRTDLTPLSARLVQQLPTDLRHEHRLWNPITESNAQRLFEGRFPNHPVDPLEALRLAARGLCTHEELLSLDRARLLR